MVARQDYIYNEFDYAYNLSHYFSIAFVEIFGGKVFFMLDYNPSTDETKLLHTFVGLVPHIFIDAKGVFRDIADRQEEFHAEHYSAIVSFDTVSEVKDTLKVLKVGHSNSEKKRNVREYLRSNLPVFDVMLDNERTKIGLTFVEPPIERGTISCFLYDSQKKKFGRVLYKVSRSTFEKSVICYNGFVNKNRWYYNMKR